MNEQDRERERNRKTVAGWKGSADRCRNCVSFKPCVFEQPPMVPGAPGLKFEPHLCKLNDFRTYPNSWCEDHQRHATKRSESDSEQGQARA